MLRGPASQSSQPRSARPLDAAEDGLRPNVGIYPLAPAPVVCRSADLDVAGRFPTPQRNDKHHAKPWWSIAFGTSQLQAFSVCYLGCSLADLMMTFSLLRRGTHFYEANPVALWFITRWNTAGMVFFKFGVVALAIALSEIIERKRPGWGKFVLGLGCAAALYAVWKGYSIGFSPTALAELHVEEL